jgi:hypothetical protein
MGSNFRRRSGVYWFRRRVPDALKIRLGRTEINRSSRTTSSKEARKRARQAWLATEAAFREMSSNPTLTTRQAKLLVGQFLDEQLLASPTADDLVDSYVDGDGAIGRLLFNR